SMREAAACLRRIAGIDPTAPPARVEPRRAPPPPPPATWPFPVPHLLLPEEPESAPSSRRRGVASVMLMLTVLLVGLAAGGAAVALRPDLIAALARSVGGTSEAEPRPPPRRAPPPAQPAQVAPPVEQAPPAPVWSDRLGGTRAERGSEQRAR